MKKILTALFVATIVGVFAVSAFAVEEAVYAQPKTTTTAVTTTTTTCSQPFGGKFKIEGYAEYINFNKDVDASTWGGGILARYLFTNWLGAQTNVTFYSDADSDNTLGGKLSFANWRATLLLHAYLTDISDRLYVYGGPGLGVQFNDNVGDVKVDNAFTGHILGGVGFDINEYINVGVEVGYQFGSADTDNYYKSSVDVDALFVRLGAGLRF